MRGALNKIATAVLSFLLAAAAATAAPLLDDDPRERPTTYTFQDLENKHRAGSPDFHDDATWQRSTESEMHSLQNLLSKQVKSLSRKIEHAYQEACNEGRITPGTNRTVYIVKEVAEDAMELTSYVYHTGWKVAKPALRALGDKLPEWEAKWNEFKTTPLGRAVAWGLWLFGPSLGFIQVPLALLIKGANGALSVPYVMWALLRWMLPISASITLFPLLFISYYFVSKRSPSQARASRAKKQA